MNRYREKTNLDWLQRQPNHKEKNLHKTNTQGWRLIHLLAQTAIYSTWLPPQPQGSNAALARVKLSVEWQCPTNAWGVCLHQMTPEPKGRASDGGEDRWHACRSVHLREGGFLKRLFWTRREMRARLCVCVFVWKVVAVSHAINERPPDNHTGIRPSPRSSTGVLWHLQTGGRTYPGLPVVFINLFPFSTTDTWRRHIRSHGHQGEYHLN